MHIPAPNPNLFTSVSIPTGYSEVVPDDTDMRLIVFRSFYAFRHRFHRVDTSSTAANATTQTSLLL
jgi:hypothetical protein